jgi:hypothetical protein
MFVKNPGLPQPKPYLKPIPQPPGDPFAFDVISEQPSEKPDNLEQVKAEAGGWLDGTMS